MYGVDFEDKCLIDRKLDKQKEFLENFVIDFGDKSFSLLDNAYSANLNPKKYFSEINNRVNSINKYAKSNGLMPVFITLTAPSKYHPQRTINKKKKIFVDNPNYAYKNNFNGAVKDSARLLSDLWHKFTSLQIVRKMKKETGHGLIYFRVFEPHESGIPHIHAMLYIPKKFVLPIKKRFFEYFKTHKKHKILQLQYKYTWYKDKGGAVAYMMKYITKTFKNAQTDILDDSAYWYVKHRIIRFSNSRLLAPLAVYRKVRYFFKDDFEDDYLYISNLFNSGDIQYYFNKTMINYRCYNPDEDDYEITLYSKRFIPNLSKKKYIYAYIDKDGNKKYKEILIDDFKSRIKLKYNKRERIVKKDIPLIINDKEYVLLENGIIIKKVVTPAFLDDQQLINYYYHLNKNIDDNYINLSHYGVEKKEMIKRKILNDIDISLNLYGFDI